MTVYRAPLSWGQLITLGLSSIAEVGTMSPASTARLSDHRMSARKGGAGLNTSATASQPEPQSEKRSC